MSHGPPNAQARPKALHLSTASAVLSKARQHINLLPKRAHSGVKAQACGLHTLSQNHSSPATTISPPSSSLLRPRTRIDPLSPTSARDFSRVPANAEKGGVPDHSGSASNTLHGKRRTSPTEGENTVDSTEYGCSPHPVKRLRRDGPEKVIERDVEMEDSMPMPRPHINGGTGIMHPRLPSSIPSSIPSSKSKWQSPQTSLLGPRTSKYIRRSKSGHFPVTPCKAFPNFTVKCLVRELQKDNRKRKPTVQHPQWCEDLFVSGLQRVLHPLYKCQHRYHPCDPEYHEDQSDSDIDIDLSDDEDDEDDYDCLPTPSDPEDVKMDVAIHATEEHRPQPDTIKVDRETYRWTKWHNNADNIQNIPPPWAMNDTVASADVDMPMPISTYLVRAGD